MLLKDSVLYKKHKKYLDWTRQSVPLNDFSGLELLKKIDDEFEKEPKFKELKAPTEIVIHHAEIDGGNRDMYHWLHKALFGWDAVGYHFIIGNGKDNLSIDGNIEIGRELKYQGAHVRNHNHYTIGICLTGNFDNYQPTEKQMESLKKLVKELREQFNINSELKYHRDFDDVTKSCPGKMFPDIKGKF